MNSQELTRGKRVYANVIGIIHEAERRGVRVIAANKAQMANDSGVVCEPFCEIERVSRPRTDSGETFVALVDVEDVLALRMSEEIHKR